MAFSSPVVRVTLDFSLGRVSPDNGATFFFANNPAAGRSWWETDALLWHIATDDRRLRRSTDQGVTWNIVGIAVPGAEAIEAFIRLLDGTFLVGVDGPGITYNVYRSTDEGTTWSAKILIGVGLWKRYCMYRSPLTDTVMTIGGNIDRSSDRGITWTMIQAETPTFYIHSGFVTRAGTFLMAEGKQNNLGAGERIWRSINDGVSFVLVFEQLAVDASDQNFFVHTRFAQSTSGRLFFARRWRSDDDGATWSDAGGDDGGSMGQSVGAVYSAAHITFVEALRRSTDNGLTWSLVGMSCVGGHHEIQSAWSLPTASKSKKMGDAGSASLFTRPPSSFPRLI